MLTLQINRNIDGSVLVSARSVLGLWEGSKLISPSEMVSGQKDVLPRAVRELERDMLRDVCSVLLVAVAFASLFVWGWSTP